MRPFRHSLASHLGSGSLLLLLHCTCSAEIESMPAPAACVIQVGTIGLRLRATHAPLPPYPPETLHAGRSGVVVAHVQVQPDGQVGIISILESPDSETAAAVRATLGRWRFSALARSSRASDCIREGRSVFYFKLEANRGVVLDAAASKSEKRASPSSTIGRK